MTTAGQYVLAALLTITTLIACHRYQPYTPREVVFADATAAYDGALGVLSRNGYEVTACDEKHGLIQVKAKLDGGIRVSHITLRTRADGLLRIDADGDHFRDGHDKAHRKLLQELDLLQELLAREAWQGREDPSSGVAQHVE
jgi:hypothetical protein